MLKGKKILIGITGSIAAYKIPLLVRLLVKAGAEVRIVMTKAATEFVSPLTLATLSKNEVLTDLSENNSWANHVMLGRWADIMLVAPLSCNTLAKFATGNCDNLLTAVYFSSTCTVAVAPAMDEDMWKHPATKANIQKIQTYNNLVLPVGSGELASGLIGEGRMAEPDEVFEWINKILCGSNELKGKKALVTAGPTYEKLDPVRFIGNHSSGKMGLAIAMELAVRGAEVLLVLGPSGLEVPANIRSRRVQSAAEMFDECISVFAEMDIAVMSAAVADYTPSKVAHEKIKKDDGIITLELEKTKDILKHLGLVKNKNQFLVGFALETNNEMVYAQKKLKEKNADMIVLNSLNDKGAGFGYDTNKITIFDKKGNIYPFETKSKKEVAVDIVNTIVSSIL